MVIHPGAQRICGGMNYFLSPRSRRIIFNKLFIGPVNRGLFDYGNNYTNIIPDDYKYKPSKSDPFPTFNKLNN